MTGPSSTDLLRVRAALTVGLPPAEALAAAVDRSLSDIARHVRLGQPMATIARSGGRGRTALGPGPLLRGLALAERSGHGAVEAVDVALDLHHAAMVDELRLAARTAQATGTARLLTVLPLAAWALLMVVDPSALGFYATPPGWLCGVAAVVLGTGGHLWSRVLVRRAAAAAALADPLADAPAPFDAVRAMAVALPVAGALWTLAHPVVGVVAAALVAAWAGRPRTTRTPPPMTTLEVVQLLSMLLRADLGLAAALEQLAEVAADPLDGRLRAIGRQLRAGADTEAAFAGTGLAEVGALLAVTERWGVAPAGPLRLLGDTVRVRQRAAAETAAERVQLALVFPTTLLTLPAFVVAVVPPLVWTALTA